MQVLASRWILPPDPLPGSGEEDHGFPPILRQLLYQRGIRTEIEIKRFLEPRLRDLSDPFLLPEMRAAVDRVFAAIDRREKICIFGDYDVDGITSIALLLRVLRAHGAEPRHFVPIRGIEGYGLSAEAVERCMNEGPRPDLLVAVDCGTASVDEIAKLRAAGVEIVVVDHHEPGPKGRPDCCAFVNPKGVPGGDLTYL